MLTHVGGNIDDGGDHALRDKTCAITDDADGFTIRCEESMRGISHIGAGHGVGGEHAALGLFVVNQHVDAHGAGGIKPLDNGNGCHIKA